MDARWHDVTACPACRGRVSPGEESFACDACGARFPVVRGVPMLLRPERREELRAALEEWDRQAVAPRGKGFLQSLRAPDVHRTRAVKRSTRALLDALPADGRAVDVGSGSDAADPRLLRLDIGPFAGVGVGGDLLSLPFRDASLDLVVCHRVLEHVVDPAAAVAEMRRVLKPGGRMSLVVPFIQPFHLSPIDHGRFTRDSIRRLAAGFREERLVVSAGPLAAWVWATKEAAAISVPFSGVSLWYAAVREIVGWLLWPVSWLDPLVRGRDRSHKLACEFLYVGVRE